MALLHILGREETPCLGGRLGPAALARVYTDRGDYYREGLIDTHLVANYTYQLGGERGKEVPAHAALASMLVICTGLQLGHWGEGQAWSLAPEEWGQSPQGHLGLTLDGHGHKGVVPRSTSPAGGAGRATHAALAASPHGAPPRVPLLLLPHH